MPRTGEWLRVFAALLVAVLPPLIALVAAVLLTDSILVDADPSLVAAFVVVAAIVWAALLAILYSRGLADDIRALLALAERGDGAPGNDLGEAYRQLAGSLDERNRQLGALATATSRMPIDDSPTSVVGSVVTAVREITGDTTWRCAILVSDDETLLPPGTYDSTREGSSMDPVSDLERWAAASSTEPSVDRLEGPWGAFLVIGVAASDRMRAVLFAPWEGRPAPTPAEVSLLTLVGQHAATAIEHSLLYARVRSQADELDRMAGIQADFLRGVTHDLQTPLTSIAALATELRANVNIPEEGRADLEAIGHQAERLRRMVSQLLVASRLEAGVLTSEQEVFAVQPLVERTWSALRADRPFELRTEGAAHLAVGDPDRLEQVLWALLDNAVKYSSAGSPVSVSIRPDGPELTITVADSGVGMDNTTRHQAFDQFFRAEDARRLAPDGSGVGLYAARGLMAAMGGSISVTSELGKGTAFTLRVPAEPSEADE